jgi:hypothetical protein
VPSLVRREGRRSSRAGRLACRRVPLLPRGRELRRPGGIRGREIPPGRLRGGHRGQAGGRREVLLARELRVGRLPRVAGRVPQHLRDADVFRIAVRAPRLGVRPGTFCNGLLTTPACTPFSLLDGPCLSDFWCGPGLRYGSVLVTWFGSAAFGEPGGWPDANTVGSTAPASRLEPPHLERPPAAVPGPTRSAPRRRPRPSAATARGTRSLCA